MRLLVADDHALIRQALIPLLHQAFPNADIDQANSYGETLSFIKKRYSYDLLLLDLNMPGYNQGQTIRNILNITDSPCVVISGLSSSDVIRRTLEVDQIKAFVDKGVDSETLINVIKSVTSGLNLGQVSAQMHSCNNHNLPPRLNRVNLLLKQGLSNKEISRELNISEGTVKNYLTEIFKILNVRNRTQAAQKVDDFFS